VEIRSAAGHVLECDVRSDGSVMELKRQVNDHWQIPGIFQQLVVGSALLGDHDRLGAHCPCRAKPLMVTLRVCWARVVKYLWGQSNAEQRTLALEALGPLVLRDGQASITAVSSLLDHEEIDVRRAAIDALSAVAAPGHDEVDAAAPAEDVPTVAFSASVKEDSHDMASRLASRALLRDRASGVRQRRAVQVASVLLLKMGAKDRQAQSIDVEAAA